MSKVTKNPNTVRQIIYTSRATEEYTNNRLHKLLRICRKFNSNAGISGILMYRKGFFAQCIEGSPDAIDYLYRKRIALDPHHESIVVLYDQKSKRRSFPQWSMGCIGISDSQVLELETADWEKVIEEREDSGKMTAGFALMQSMWENHKHLNIETDDSSL